MTLQLSRDAQFERKPLSYEAIASSEPFRFTVGPENRQFNLPSALVAAQSPAFDRLVNGEFKEAGNCKVELDNVEEETFIHFVQFAYTGKYDEIEVAASPAPNNSADSAEGAVEIEAEPELPAPAIEELWGWTSSSMKTSKAKKKKTKKGKYDSTSTAIVFQALGEKFMKKIATLTVDDSPETIRTMQLGGTPTLNPFLTHARVFVFADYWGITMLRDISLERLGKALKDASVNTRVVRDRVVALVDYCYEDARPEELVSLVKMYAAFKLPQLWESGKFREIFGDNKELSVSLVGTVVESGL